MRLCLPRFPPLPIPVLYSLSATPVSTAILSAYLCSLLSSSSAAFYPDMKTTYMSPPLNMVLLWPLPLLLSTIWFLVHDSLFCSSTCLRPWKIGRNWRFISVFATIWGAVVWNWNVPQKLMRSPMCGTWIGRVGNWSEVEAGWWKWITVARTLRLGSLGLLPMPSAFICRQGLWKTI